MTNLEIRGQEAIWGPKASFLHRSQAFFHVHKVRSQRTSEAKLEIAGTVGRRWRDNHLHHHQDVKLSWTWNSGNSSSRLPKLNRFVPRRQPPVPCMGSDVYELALPCFCLKSCMLFALISISVIHGLTSMTLKQQN